MPLTASFDSAKQFFADKDYYRAKVAIEDELFYQPDDADVVLLAGRIYLALGDEKKAEEMAARLQKQDPADQNTLLLLEDIRRYQRLSDENKRALQRKALLQEGEELDIMGEKDQALAFFLKAEAEDPDYPPYLYQIGLIYSQKQQWKEAEDYLKATLYHDHEMNRARVALAEVYHWQSQNEKAMYQIDLALQKTPDNEQALALAALIYYQNHRYRKAREYYKKLLEINPNNMEARQALKRMKGKFLLEKQFNKEGILSEHRIPLARKADQYALEGEYEKALFLYQHLLQEYPDDSWYLYKAGTLEASLKNFEKAKRYYEEAIIEDPYNHDARVGLGTVFYRDGHFKKALEQADIVLAQNPKNTDALLLAGRCFVAEGLEDKGREYFKKVLEENDEDNDAHQLLAKSYQIEQNRIYIKPVLEKAKQYERNLEYEQALDLYLRLYQEYSDNVQIIYHIGRVYSLMQRYTIAENYLLLCLKVDPSFDDARVALSYVYYWQKKYDQAIEQANIVLEHHPNNVDALLAAARSYKNGENIPKAEEYLERAIALEPDHYDVLLAKAQLDDAKRLYNKAYEGYAKAHQKQRLDPFAWQGAIVTRPLVKPSVETEGGYGRERENDLIDKIYTTEMNIIDAETKIRFPVNNRFMPYMSFHFNQTEQYNAISKLNNYNIDSYFFTYGSTIPFGDFWTAELKTVHHFAENVGNTLVFPFENRYLWEPAGSIRYNVPKQNFSIGAYKDTIIARLFEISRSKLLSNKQIFLGYEYVFDAPYNAIGVFGKTGWIAGRIQNRENVMNLHFRFRIPSASPIFLVRGEYHYRGFKKVLRDYNSFKRRVEYEGIISYIKEWIPTTHLEIRYRWLWSKTEELTDQSEIIIEGVPSVPVSIPVNIFRANIGEAEIHKVFGTSFHFRFLGRYYHNTNRYRAWLLKSSLQYVF